MKLGGVAETLEVRFRIQNGLGELEKWSAIKQMKYSKDICKVLRAQIAVRTNTDWGMTAQAAERDQWG